VRSVYPWSVPCSDALISVARFALHNDIHLNALPQLHCVCALRRLAQSASSAVSAVAQ